MMNQHTPITATGNDKPSAILSMLSCKCPRCRRGNMFAVSNPYQLKSTMKMNGNCPVCRQPFDLEVGFYYGSSYVSYALSIAISVATFVAWWVLIGFSTQDKRFFFWLLANAVFLVALQPLLMRLARSVWIAFFVRYEPDWQTVEPPAPERVNKDQMNNW